jgi:MraZ protein
VFLGEHQHTIDPKGRIVLPSRFRSELAKGCFVTKGLDRCLFIFTPEQWAIEIQEVRTLSRRDRQNRNYSRVFFSGAIDQKLDKQGRVQIPAGLREYAGLDKEVTVVGVAERIEIWNTSTWQELTAGADDEYADTNEASQSGGSSN